MRRDSKRISVLVALAVLVSTGFLSALPVGAGPPAGPGLLEVPDPETYQASVPPFGPANEVHVAVNPLDEKHLLVVAKDYSLGPYDGCAQNSGGEYHVGSASYVTKDGGSNWIRSRVPAPYPVGGSPTSPLPRECTSDPVAMFGPDGTAYYVLLNYDYSGPSGMRMASVGVARSLDGGETWPESEIRVLSFWVDDDKEWGVVGSDGRIHITWVNYLSGTVKYRRTTTDFEFVDTEIEIGTSSSGNPAPQVGVGPGGLVYVFWRSGNNIMFSTSNDNGASFGSPETAFSVFAYETFGDPRFPFMPAMAVDNSPESDYTGRIYLTWLDRSGPGYSNVYLKHSDDWGDSWSDSILVDDNIDPAMRSVMPAISLSPNGHVDVAWMQEVSDTNVFYAFAARSDDGGDNWDRQGEISDQPVDADYSFHQDGSSFVGDYIGSASTNCAIWVAHPESYQPYVGVKYKRTDAFLTKVPTCSRLDDAIHRINILAKEVGKRTKPPIWEPPCDPLDCPLNRGQGRSLITKLEGALGKLENLDKLNVRSADGKIKAFYNEVKALMKTSVIPSKLGHSWLVSASEIRDILRW
jgi:hypothetical protein